MAETQHDAGDKRHDHERRDVNIRWVAYFGGGLVVLLLGSAALMGWLFGLFDVERRRVATPALVAEEARPLPPGPRLQASPAQDMLEMRRTENTLLHHYAWVDPSTGIVRIPIARAMKLVATQGLPEWRPAPGTQPEQTEAPGRAPAVPRDARPPEPAEGGS